MITCGGQATIPMVGARSSRVQPVALRRDRRHRGRRSPSDPGTRANIDEFTRTTAGAVETVGGADEGKAIIIINPAEPPLIMRDTIYCLTEDEADQDAHQRPRCTRMIAEVQTYVPGYRLVNGPRVRRQERGDLHGSRRSWRLPAARTPATSTS